MSDRSIYHRTITLTDDRRNQIADASCKLGISGERLIQDAITDYLARTYGLMVLANG